MDVKNTNMTYLYAHIVRMNMDIAVSANATETISHSLHMDRHLAAISMDLTLALNALTETGSRTSLQDNTAQLPLKESHGSLQLLTHSRTTQVLLS